MSYPKVAQLKDIAALRARLAELGLELPIDDRILTAAQGSPLASPLDVGGFTIGNRWCIHPMEGWDANRDGSPSPHTLRRWRNFGLSGAKLIWGGEAAAVQPDGRANPNQTLATSSNRQGLAELLAACRTAHREAFGSDDDLFVGLQLTHSGRFCRPNDKRLEPRIAYHHPLLDAKFGIDPHDQSVVWTDDELERLIDDYVAAAGLAREVGYQFVDVKACHGYLLHEFLSARSRPGVSAATSRAARGCCSRSSSALRDRFPDLQVVVRLSVFDTLPYKTSREIGQPMDYQHLLPYEFGFGVDANDPLKFDLTEPIELIRRLHRAGVAAVNLSCGSPYYNPHIQRPAIFPPSDGYQPPEDPLVGVARQIDAARKCKQAVAGNADGRHRLFLPARLRAARGPGSGPRRLDRRRRPRPHGALLSRTAGRHAAHRHPRPQKNLPHVQRLHHRPAQRHYLGLLPARSVLQSSAPGGRFEEVEGELTDHGSGLRTSSQQLGTTSK